MKGVRTKRAWGLRIAAAAWLSASSVHAQLASDQAAAPRELGAAAQAFQEGQKAQLEGEFARAAQMFELADELAPTPQALRSAIRNRDAAGHPARAASLALAALERYPTDLDTATTAQQVIDRVAPELSRVSIACDEPCTVSFDGEAVTKDRALHAELYAPPGAHRIEARFGEGRDSVVELELIAGSHEQRTLHAPALSPTGPVVNAPPEAPARDIVHLPPVRALKSQGLSPWYAAGAGALTLASATAAAVFGFDALRKRDAYEVDPTRDRYEAGVESQKWTNALWIATGGLAATSLVLLAFTDWEGEQERTTATLSLSPLAANLVVRSSLP